jgi:replicative DNA helicase
MSKTIKELSLKELGFIPIADSYEQAIEYIKKRRDGDIRSIKTPWNSFNRATMNGIEWNSLTVIAGRPASGKTLIGSIITRDAFIYNPEQDFCVLDFQFEMLSRTIAMREISAKTNISSKILNSANEKISDEDLESAIKFCETHKHREIYTYERSLTVDKMRQMIYAFYEKIGKNIIVTIDHSLLIRKGASEKDRIESLYNLGNMLAEIRREIPLAIIVLSQLNRDIESTERTANGKAGNYVKDSDVFGADALLQFTDVLVGINRPAKYGIKQYGDDKYEVHENILAAHFLKVRNGEVGLTFFEADFGKSSIYETSVRSSKYK